MKKYVTPGIVLILAGLYFLLGALPGVNLPEGTFFVLVGLGLLIGRLTTGKCGVGGGLLILFTPGLNALLKPYYGTIFPALLILVGICLLVRGIAHSHRAPKPQQNAANASYSYSDTSTWAQPPLHNQPRQEAPAADAAAAPDAPAAETAAAPDAAEAQENTYTAPVDAPEEAVDSTDESQVKED